MKSCSMKFVTLALGLALVAGGAEADTWRMAHKMPAESIEGQMFQAFADAIEEKTGGEIEVQVYPNEQLGSDDVILEQLQLGTVHIYPEGDNYLQKWLPAMKYVTAPFLFKDRDHWARFMKSDLVQGWLDQIEDVAGIAVIGESSKMVRGPYRVIVSSREIGGLEDVEGLKLRMHPDELAAAAWRHLGAEVRTLAWTEVYESIGRGIVEAVNSPVSLVEPMRFYEVAPYVARHNEFPQGLAYMTNAEVWNGLDEETRAQILEAYDEVAAEFEPKVSAIATESLENMAGEGVTYVELDTAPFVAKMAEFYADLDAKGELPEGFLDAVNATRDAQ